VEGKRGKEIVSSFSWMLGTAQRTIQAGSSTRPAISKLPDSATIIPGVDGRSTEVYNFLQFLADLWSGCIPNFCGTWKYSGRGTNLRVSNQYRYFHQPACKTCNSANDIYFFFKDLSIRLDGGVRYTCVKIRKKSLEKEQQQAEQRATDIEQLTKQTEDIKDFVHCNDCNAPKDVPVFFRSPSIGRDGGL
jgi:hypothetical protein